VSFTLYRLQEATDGSATGTWVPVQSYTNDKNVLLDHWSAGAVNSTAPGFTAWTSNVPPSTSGFMVSCKPDGTCDAKTVFFCRANTANMSVCDTAGLANEVRAKLSVMPLGGAISTRTDWN
jgi:hypothetical protein